MKKQLKWIGILTWTILLLVAVSSCTCNNNTEEESTVKAFQTESTTDSSIDTAFRMIGDNTETGYGELFRPQRD